MKLYVRNVVLPNVACILLSVGYMVFMFMVLVPQMDLQHSKGDAFVVTMGVLVGLYGLTTPIDRIVDAYIEKWEQERNHYLSVKNTFALFNQYYMDPDDVKHMNIEGQGILSLCRSY